VTPVGVRDGDPDALAGLCDRRGPAVLAYCEVVAGRGESGAIAAAEAFGSFRAGVVAAPDLASLNPEALLISATRHAAARYAGIGLPAEHGRVPALLAARADRSITLADNDFLEQHLAECWTCRAPVARFEAADRAYLDPPATALEPAVKAAMVAALTAAAPVLGAEPEPAPYVPEADPAAAFPNGSGPHEPEGYVEQPTSAYQIGVDDVDLVGAPLEPDPAAAAPPEPRTGRGRGMTRRPRSEAGADRPAHRSRRARGASAVPTAAPTPVAVGAAAVEATEDPRAGGGTNLPRPQRAISASTRGRRRPALRPGVVLPVALVILAIIVALVIAGVFGGGEPASNPQSFAPTSSEPVDTAPAAPVVEVPGAATASADAVEKAKARARRLAAEKKAGGATTITPAATTTPPPPPAAAAQPAGTSDAASTPPPPPPPPPAATNTSASKKPKIDASQGATGAEQLPQKKDTSSVPDLAPAAEPVAPPN